MIDSEHFRTSYDAIGGKLIGFLCNRGLARDVAEDIAQETWLKAWKSRAQFNDAYTFDSWIFLMAKSVLIGSLYTHRKRGEACRKRRDSQLIAADNMLPHHENFDNRIDAEKLLGRCPPRAAALLRTYYLEDSIPEGRSVGAFRVRLHEARLAARAAIKRESIQ